jgi:hypothetical protein
MQSTVLTQHARYIRACAFVCARRYERARRAHTSGIHAESYKQMKLGEQPSQYIPCILYLYVICVTHAKHHQYDKSFKHTKCVHVHLMQHC